MLLPKKEDELKRFLEGLPIDKAVALATTIEQEQLAGKPVPGADTILEGLRPLLRRAGRKRSPMPRRLVCAPFEDLLIDGPRPAKQTGRILRATVRAMWAWLEAQPVGEQLREFELTAGKQFLAGETIAGRATIAKMRDAIIATLRTALAGAKKGTAAREKLAAAFGGEAGLGDLDEIALLIDTGEIFEPLRHTLPLYIENLNDQLLSVVRDSYDVIAETRPELCPYVALIVLGRLAKPWESLKLAGVVSRRRDEILFSSTDMGVVGDLLISDLEKVADELSALRGKEMQPDLILPMLEKFAELANGLIHDIGLRRDGRWGQQVMKVRHIVADAMDVLIARAPKEITAALPVQKIGSFAGHSPTKPDMSKAPDEKKVDRALAWARLLVESEPFATGGAFQAAHRSAMEKVQKHMRQYADTLIAELRAAEDDMRPKAQPFLQTFESLGERLLGEEETDLFRRRVAASHQPD